MLVLLLRREAVPAAEVTAVLTFELAEIAAAEAAAKALACARAAALIWCCNT